MAVLQHDEDGDVLVRENVILCLFAKQAPQLLGPAIQAMFDRWIKLLPDGLPQFSLIGASASSFRKVGRQNRVRLAAELDPANLTGRDLSHARWQAPVETGPDWRFLTTLSERAADPEQPRTNFVEMLFPIDVVQRMGSKAFISEAIALASLIPFDTGYAAPALTWGSDQTILDAGAIIGGVAMRHHGYDVSKNDTTAYLLGRLCRGARWLSFLGDSALSDLGGAEAVRAALPAAVEIAPAGSGVVLVASPEPEIGDVNRRDVLPALRQVATVLEPITLFGDRHLNVLFAENPELRARWERRLLD